MSPFLGSREPKPQLGHTSASGSTQGERHEFAAKSLRRPDVEEPFLRDVADRLHANGWFDAVPDQVIVNEYEPGQGIAAHVDRGCFGPTVATLSLGDAWPMEFAPYRPRRGPGTASEEKSELVLEVGSILLLTGDARWNWTHRIAARTKDGPRSRQKRVSVTFRAVVRPAPGRRASFDATRSVPGSRV